MPKERILANRTQIDKAAETLFFVGRFRRKTDANFYVCFTSVFSYIRITMHPGHIEISSPGGLPAGLGRDEYLRGFISQLRNPILANVLFRLNIIEMFGTGIVRIRSSHAEYEQKPEFDVSENAVRVTLPVTDARSALTSDEELVYRFVKEEGSAASGQIVANFGFGKDKAVKLLRSLVEKRYVEKTGTGRGTEYHA